MDLLPTRFYLPIEFPVETKLNIFDAVQKQQSQVIPGEAELSSMFAHNIDRLFERDVSDKRRAVIRNHVFLPRLNFDSNPPS